MAKTSSSKKKKEAKSEPAPSAGMFAPVKRAILTVLALSVILYVFAILFARTDGFRSYLESRLQDAFGLHLEIKQSKVGWTGDLWLQDVGPAAEVEAGQGSVRIHQAQINCRLWDLLTLNPNRLLRGLVVQDWALTFVQTVEGSWEPAVLTRCNAWLSTWCQIDVMDRDDIGSGGDVSGRSLDESIVEVEPEFDLKKVRLELTGGAIAWLDAEGETLTSAHDVDVFVTPLSIPTREATHIHVRASTIQQSPWSEIRDVNVELLRTGDSYRVLQLKAERHDIAHPAGPETAGELPVVLPELVDRVVPAPSQPPIQEEPLPEVSALPAAKPVPAKAPPQSALEEIIRQELEQALEP